MKPTLKNLMGDLYLIIKYRYLYILPVLLLLISSCTGGTGKNKSAGKPEITVPPANDEFYQDITASVRLDFVQSIGSDDLTNIVESSGGGAIFLDYNRDGFIDIFACSGIWIDGFSKGNKPERETGNRLYRNLGNGTFEDVTKKAGITGSWYTMGATSGDYNNDGYPDIYLTNYGANVLLKNNGNGSFTDVTKRAGVAGKKECSIGAVWLDYDNDSHLDLYVGNYLAFDPDYKYYYAPDGFPGPMAYDAEKDYLYHNNGDGTFSDVTDAMGITDLDGRAMGVGAADIDDDGFTDIFVANDHTMNYLWHNEGGKKFVDIGIKSGTAFSQAGEATVSMAVDFADFNGDQLLDLFVSDDTYCSLYQNLGNGVFADKANPSGISVQAAQFVGWSSTFMDYDNDSDADLLKTNGALKHLYGQEDQLFQNDGNGKFNDISASLGSYFTKAYVGRGACVGDYDNDGDLDIFIANLNSNCIFLRNNKGNQNNWIMLDLEGKSSNRDGIGAKITVTSGGKSQTTQKRTTAGYLSQNDPRIHFGLSGSQSVEKIEIKWPSGKVQTLKNIKPNQILKIIEP